MNVSFSGMVTANTLLGNADENANEWISVGFIKDLAPDYSSLVQTTVSLGLGAFSISLLAMNDPGAICNTDLKRSVRMCGSPMWPRMAPFNSCPSRRVWGWWPPVLADCLRCSVASVPDRGFLPTGPFGSNQAGLLGAPAAAHDVRNASGRLISNSSIRRTYRAAGILTGSPNFETPFSLKASMAKL